VRNNISSNPTRIGIFVLAVLLVDGISQAAAPAADDTADARLSRASEPADGLGGNGSPTPSSGDADSWTVAVYPILAWLPIFGASVELPSLPSLPGSGGNGGGTSIFSSGTTNLSFNGAALAGVSVQEKQWIVDFDGLWAGLSASRTLPHLSLSTDAIYGDFFAGHRIYRHLSLTGGVRRMALNIHAQLGSLPEAHWKPGVWDPMVGLDWRQAFGRKWLLRLDLAGGGFGVGDDVDLSASFRADWRFAHHFGLTIGYGALHFQNSTTVLDQVHKTKQTLDGPIFGFGIYL
jgi:hypothetical protein